MTIPTGVRRMWVGSVLMGLLAPALGAQTPERLLIPGRIEAERYDAFYDSTAGNLGKAYRNDAVDIEATTDAEGDYNIYQTTPGEWLNYTVEAAATAVYRIDFRMAATNPASRMDVTLDGLPLCSVTAGSSGLQHWQTLTVSNLVIPAGTRSLRVEFREAGQKLNYLEVQKQGDLAGGFLRVSGKQIVDAAGHNVVLRGMGLGNWMLQEPYMMEASRAVQNQQQLKARITDLVGAANCEVFYQAWLTNSFGEADVIALAKAGFNSIRLPMHYDLFTLPVAQEPVAGRNTWLPRGFKLVDELLAWCEQHQLYLILDTHACPGGQGHDKPISDYNPPAPSLWEDAANRAKLVALWRELAARYAQRSWIGGYDLINEPNWTFEKRSNINGCDDQTNAPLRQLLQEMTTAIREVDTNHIIFLEGNCWGGNYNGILPPWDANLVLSFHKYWDQPTAASFQSRVALRDRWNMPIWLGESGENSNLWFRETIRNAEALNIGWAWWPWKKIGAISGPVLIQKPAGYQAILNYWNKTGPRPDPDAAMKGLLALAKAARLENCSVRADVLDALLRPNTDGQTLPFKQHAIPGVIFAADYDLGRMGEAYNDRSTNNPHNTGNHYRNDAVDIEACTDTPPTIGYSVGWLDPGDWMKYTVAIPAGRYSVTARAGANAAGGSFYIEIGEADVSGTITVPATGGWHNWTNLPPRVFTNSTAADAFKVVVQTGGFNLHRLQFKRISD